MNNISDIKSKLILLKESNELLCMFNNLAEKSVPIPQKDSDILQDEIQGIVSKLIKHLDSKRPGKSSITGLIQRSFLRLQYKGVRFEFLELYIQIINRIMEVFKGAFSERLNVKSREFMDLEDCDPF
ncbi:MAG: hypothetical protein H6549_05575 [Chitinophagales bacterium]|nr:hypothetical protein [Chitinophagales bacterium]